MTFDSLPVEDGQQTPFPGITLESIQSLRSDLNGMFRKLDFLESIPQDPHAMPSVAEEPDVLDELQGLEIGLGLLDESEESCKIFTERPFLKRAKH